MRHCRSFPSRQHHSRCAVVLMLLASLICHSASALSHEELSHLFSSTTTPQDSNDDATIIVENPLHEAKATQHISVQPSTQEDSSSNDGTKRKTRTRRGFVRRMAPPPPALSHEQGEALKAGRAAFAQWQKSGEDARKDATFVAALDDHIQVITSIVRSPKRCDCYVPTTTSRCIPDTDVQEAKKILKTYYVAKKRIGPKAAAVTDEEISAEKRPTDVPTTNPAVSPASEPTPTERTWHEFGQEVAKNPVAALTSSFSWLLSSGQNVSDEDRGDAYLESIGNW